MKSLTQKLLLCTLLPFVVVLAAPAQAKIDTREIIEKINRGEPVTYRNAEIVGDLDLTALANQQALPDKSSSQTFYVNTVGASLTFTGCTFAGAVIATRQPGHTEIFYTRFASDARFQDCIFKGETNFRHAVFDGGANFDGSRFGAGTEFRHTDFTRSPSFRGTTFGGGVDFRHTSFRESPDFAEAVFGQGADFRHVEFPGGVRFEHAVFEAEADFNHAGFTSPVQWKGVTFRSGVSSRHAQLDGQAYQIRAAAESAE
jgi:uncharacterized protein YjbI with pentapeptide repeats